MQINDFAPVKYQEFDTTRPSFGSVIASEIGKGGKVEISIGNEIYLVDINPKDGSWKWAADKDFADGTYSLSIRAIDLAGNTSKPALYSVIIDTTPPNAPILINLKDDVGAEQGSFDPNKIIDDPRPTLTGVAQKNTIVYLRDENNNDLGSAQANEQGIWVLEPANDLPQGVHNLHLVAVEHFAGKDRVGVDSKPFTLNISDHVVPADTVLIIDATDNVGSTTGKLSNGAVTDDSQPELHGEATAGSTVIIYYRLAGSNVWAGSETVTLNFQNWSWTPSAGLPTGKYEFQASIGKVSSPLFTLDITTASDIEKRATIDFAQDDFGPAMGPLANNSITDDTTPTLHGSGEANGKVVVRWVNASGTEGSATVDVDSAGRWQWTPATALAVGNWNFSVKAVGASAWNSAFTLKIATSASELEPVLVEVLDDAGSNTGALKNGAVTDDHTPTLKGIAEANATVYIRIVNGSDIQIKTVLANNKGEWEFTPENALAEGQYSFSVGSSKDAFGPAFNLVIDNNADTPTTLDEVFDNVNKTGVVASNGSTDDTTPELKGSGVAGSTITIRYKLGNGAYTFSSVTVDDQGSWNWTAPELAKGKWSFEVQKAGLIEWSAPYVITIDPEFDIGPLQPKLLGYTDNAGTTTGNFGEGSTTDDATPTLFGTGRVGSVVFIKYGRSGVGPWDGLASTVVESDGTWSWTFNARESTTNIQYVFQTYAQDATGTSPSTPSYRFTVALPVVPIIKHAYDDAGVNPGDLKSGSFTTDTKPTLHGVGESEGIVIIRWSNTAGPVGSEAVHVKKDGTWAWEPSSDLAQGKWTFEAKADGAASWKAAFELNIDATADIPLTIDRIIDDSGVDTGLVQPGSVTDDTTPTLEGRAAPGSIINIRYRSGSGSYETASVKAQGDGSWSWTAPELKNGNWEFEVQKGGHTEWAAKTEFTIDQSSDIPTLISRIEDNVGSIIGDIAQNGTTDDNKPTLYGSASPGVLVMIKIELPSGQQNFSTLADASGAWTFTPLVALKNGKHTFSVKAGSQNFGSDFTINIDTGSDVATTIVRIEDNAGSVTGDVANQGITDDTTPTLYGQSAPGALVTIKITKNGVESFASIKANASGQWNWTPSTALTNGDYSFAVKAGAQDFGTSFTIKIDTTIDTAATIDSVTDNVGAVTGAVGRGGITDDTTPTLQGTAPANTTLTVRYKLGNGSWSSTTVNSDAAGNWTWTTPNLGNGTYTFQVQKPGSSWSSDFVLTIDPTVDREALIDHAVDNVGVGTGNLSSGGSTDDNTPTLHGSAPKDAIISVRYKLGNGSWNTTSITADTSGNWNWTAPALANGTYTFQVQKAGGKWSSDFKLSIDTNLDTPHVPTIVDAYDDFGPETGVVKHDGNTDDSTPTIRGTGTAGEVIHLRYRLSNQTWYDGGSTTVDTAGKWSIVSPKFSQDGVWDFEAKSSKAGQESEWSNRFWVHFADSSYALEQVLDDVGSKQGPVVNGGITDDDKPTLTGRAPANGRIYIEVEGIGYGKTLYSVTADASGKWSWETPTLGRGEWNFRVGKSSGALSPEHKIIVDKNQDIPARILSAFDNDGQVTGVIYDGFSTDDRRPTLQGAAPALSIVYLRYSLGSTVKTASVKTDAQGKWAWEPNEALVNGTWKFEAQSSGKPWSALSLNVVDKSDSTYGKISYVEDASGGHHYQNGDATNNTRKTIHGTGVPDSQLKLTVTTANGGSQKYSIKVGSDGTWTYTIDPLDSADFQASSVIGLSLQHDDSRLYSNFFLSTKGKILPVVDYIYDDEGSKTGPVLELDPFTDTTPSLIGHGLPGEEITVFIYARLRSPIELVKTAVHQVKINDDGSWRVDFNQTEFLPISSGRASPNTTWFVIGNPNEDTNTWTYVPFIYSKTETAGIKGIAEADNFENDNAIYHIDIDDVISSGGKDLFIENSKTQLMVQGKEGDIVKLEDILPDNAQEGNWVEQNGNVTIAGVEYHVYSNSNSDAELLVQQGIKTEIV